MVNENGMQGRPRCRQGDPVGTRTVGAFAAVARGLGPLRPPRATVARARRGEMEWRSGPAELVHQLLTPFVWDMKNSCGGDGLPAEDAPGLLQLLGLAEPPLPCQELSRRVDEQP